MKRPNRTFNIFNLSALDLFASALGAFILLAVVLFPYYLKFRDVSPEQHDLEAELGECEDRLGELSVMIDEARDRQSSVQRGLDACRARLRETFLAIIMKWPTEAHDIDLHVIDPAGNHFDWENHNREGASFPGSEAQLSVDTIRGPGIEIWEDPRATPGDYQVIYHFYARNGNGQATTVAAHLYHKGGVIRLPDIYLPREGQQELVVTISVDNDGNVTVR